MRWWGQKCDLETTELIEIPIKVCVMFFNAEIYYWGCGEKKCKFLEMVTQMYGCTLINGGGVRRGNVRVVLKFGH